MMVVASGSREYKGHSVLPLLALNEILEWSRGAREPLTVVEGEGRGFDRYVRGWVELNTPGVRLKPYPAHWRIFGAYAGNLRNQQMLTENLHLLDLAVCMPHPTIGSGTRDMINRCKEAGLPVWELPWSGRELPPPPKARLVPADWSWAGSR